jgi:hypothetical protein
VKLSDIDTAAHVVDVLYDVNDHAAMKRARRARVNRLWITRPHRLFATGSQSQRATIHAHRERLIVLA